MVVLKRLLAAIFSLFFASFACSAAAQPAPVTVNVVLPLTGPGAFIGQTDQRSLAVLEDVVNKSGGIRGRPLKLNVLDDQSNQQNTVAIATQLLSAKPNVVLGPGIAGLCSAAAPLFNAARTLMWCYSPTFYPPVGGYVYASLAGSKDLMRVLVRNMRDRGIKRLGLLSTTDVTGKIGQSELLEVLKEPENRSVALVADEVFAPTDVGVAAQVTRIKAASPEALLVWTAGTPLGTALTALRDAGLQDLPVYSSSASMVWTQLAGLSSVLPKNLYFVGFGYNAAQARNPSALRKLQQFRAAVTAAGMHVDGITGLPWDATMIVVDALRALGPDATSEQLRTWVASQHGYPGISGVYDFRNDMHGLGPDDLLIVRWDPQKQDWFGVSKFGGGT